MLGVTLQQEVTQFSTNEENWNRNHLVFQIILSSWLINTNDWFHEWNENIICDGLSKEYATLGEFVNLSPYFHEWWNVKKSK
jgi:hypothetical protein